MSDSSWRSAVDLTARFVKKPARLSHLLERLPESMDAGTRRRCQYLLHGVVRNWSFLESCLDERLRKRPRPGVWASLLVANFELMDNEGDRPKVVDNAVGEIGRRYSSGERGLANAVLRRASESMEGWLEREPVDGRTLALRHSHPLWLVERWIESFGFDATRRLTVWNGQEPELFALPLGDERGEDELGEPSPWRPYRSLKGVPWQSVQTAIDAKRVYIQNPGARLAPTLLANRFEGGRILDLCAAPGGKSLFMDRSLGDQVEAIVAMDLAGPRMARLRSNFERLGSPALHLREGDLFDADPAELGQFEAVNLDAPCSNTGVMQRKPDVKWRLRAEDFGSLVELQRGMLRQASRFVLPGGWLLYSTCSIDRDENVGVADSFLETAEGQRFDLVEAMTSLPWETGHDGAGAHLFRKRS